MPDAKSRVTDAREHDNGDGRVEAEPPSDGGGICQTCAARDAAMAKGGEDEMAKKKTTKKAAAKVKSTKAAPKTAKAAKK